MSNWTRGVIVGGSVLFAGACATTAPAPGNEAVALPLAPLDPMIDPVPSAGPTLAVGHPRACTWYLPLPDGTFCMMCGCLPIGSMVPGFVGIERAAPRPEGGPLLTRGPPPRRLRRA